jgi:hypothetical protein
MTKLQRMIFEIALFFLALLIVIFILMLVYRG